MTAEEIVGLTWDGLKKFDGKTAVYIRPMYWAEHGGYMGVPADPESTRFCLCLYESPMIAPSGFSMTVSPFRRPTLETMPTNAKAGCLYPNNGRAILEAKMRGFDNCACARHAGQCRRDRLVEHLSWSRTARSSRRRRTAPSCPASRAAHDFAAAEVRLPTSKRRCRCAISLRPTRSSRPATIPRSYPSTDRGSRPAARPDRQRRGLYWEWAHSIRRLTELLDTPFRVPLAAPDAEPISDRLAIPDSSLWIKKEYFHGF
jgi:hypothetical protein